MYATIIDGKFELHEGVPSLEQMQEIVGGYIETAGRIRTSRRNVTIDVYCNEEGLLIGLPVSVVRRADCYIIAGDLVLVAGDNATGEQTNATAEELNAFTTEFAIIPTTPLQAFI